MVIKENNVRNKIRRLLDLLERYMIKEYEYSLTAVPYAFTNKLSYVMNRSTSRYTFQLIDYNCNGVHYKSPLNYNSRNQIVIRLCQAIECGNFKLVEVERWLADQIT